MIELDGLASGLTRHSWRADRKFFELFENSEILDADVLVNVDLHNHGVTVDADCEIEGSVTVACDRCLEDLVIPVKTSFSESYAPDSRELDLRQDVYDYVCTSLPMQRVHPEGGCNEETIVFLSK